MECRTCIHASFERTPTGRICRAYAGNCAVSNELTRLARECAAPCVAVTAHSVAIWPDTNATDCSHYLPATQAERKEK